MDPISIWVYWEGGSFPYKNNWWLLQLHNSLPFQAGARKNASPLAGGGQGGGSGVQDGEIQMSFQTSTKNSMVVSGSHKEW